MYIKPVINTQLTTFVSVLQEILQTKELYSIGNETEEENDVTPYDGLVVSSVLQCSISQLVAEGEVITVD